MVGDQLRRMRDQRGWTQAQLAAKCEVAGVALSRGTLAKIESRIRGISDLELYGLSQAFRVSVDALYPEDANKALMQCTDDAPRE